MAGTQVVVVKSVMFDGGRVKKLSTRCQQRKLGRVDRPCGAYGVKLLRSVVWITPLASPLTQTILYVTLHPLVMASNINAAGTPFISGRLISHFNGK